MPFLLVFWRNRSTATVVTAGSNVQARGRAKAKARSGYGSIVSVRRANPQDSRLIRKGTWVRRRRNGSSPQFGTAASKASARRIRSRYCPELVRRTR
ncbi:hypothetical protein KBZ18_10145 [Synechococcus sp. Cruz-9H2]|uniref:hypothetical protein n=1 Tax=unclassified Synechococcus TaxID=2626047 RepID=UPI0020CBE16F|nr:MULTISPECIES: hypothetical protein [unclassified Synechococcus]MCP9819853.1 hypothetical protein [Synechococcus sp. Cruz-9H2]MCP9844081.1 hypothetical protein [Synechococcus sp. Edmonson 11F2]MCP9856283.1 hypothetical protein [Synechococcus sp. Cruz-9C9]MCP9863568.1 hypothetical protein [Synechococcus sp. Cruz-7E5]MCP9870764.1 hypothetical protein [Synechococcus sp. Cruz-7B9]